MTITLDDLDIDADETTTGPAPEDEPTPAVMPECFDPLHYGPQLHPLGDLHLHWQRHPHVHDLVRKTFEDYGQDIPPTTLFELEAEESDLSRHVTRPIPVGSLVPGDEWMDEWDRVACDVSNGWSYDLWAIFSVRLQTWFDADANPEIGERTWEHHGFIYDIDDRGWLCRRRDPCRWCGWTQCTCPSSDTEY